MTPDTSRPDHGVRYQSAIFRAVVTLVLLLVVQSIVAYSTLQLFDVLPSEWTGIIDDQQIERSAHKGTVHLIKERIARFPETPPEQVLQDLQPDFGFPLAVLPDTTKLSRDILKQIKHYGIAFDEEEDDDGYIYARLNNGQYLKLGPLISPDILDANASAILVLLTLWSIVSAILFFVILYLAFATLWHESRAIRKTAHTLGEGDLTARVPRIRSAPLKMIAHVINDMAMRIELLVDHNKTMLHAMAHEFRTPLARLRFGLTMLEDADGKESKKLLNGIDGDIRELEDLVKISLDYFRMNQKTMPTKLRTVPVKKWVHKLVENLEPLKPKHFNIKLDIPDIIGTFDPELATYALRNLLLNAFKYGHSKAILHVLKEEDALIFELDDDGPGIPEQFREEVFSPFFRLEMARADGKNGYGVGLSFVRAIAELHHGAAFVVTSPLGGARFVMRFGI